MCGLAALINLNGKETFQAANILRMTDVIRHRGPDDEGFMLVGKNGQVNTYFGDDTPECNQHISPVPGFPEDHIKSAHSQNSLVALGHRRLSIIDLTAHAHQPMLSLNQHYGLIYNGEIYNFREIAKELNELGIPLDGTSDTEVLLNAYQHWGTDCLHHFNGMFAFLLIDLKNNLIFAARDRFGIKPFYYWISPNGTLAFASEIKQFTTLPGWRARVNGQRVYDYLAWGISDNTAETMFAGVQQLRPGQSITLSMDNVRSGRLQNHKTLPVNDWYTLRPRPFDGSLKESSEKFRALLSDAVRLRLRSDVPVGTCLSGGLDSSSIVVLLRQLLDKQENGEVATFSALSKVERFDEKKWIDIIVEHANTNAHYTYPELESLFEDLPSLTWHQDEPFGSTSIYAQWEVFNLVKKTNVKVMLDGQGADEQLAGYHSFYGVAFAHLLTRMKLLQLARDISSVRRNQGYSVFYLATLIADNLLPNSMIQLFRKSFNKSNAAPDWINLAALGAYPEDPLLDKQARGTSINKVNYAQIMETNLQRLLHFEDRNSMAHSVEARVPFLDHNLVEFLLGIPDEHKLSGGVTKLVLREGMKSLLPETIRMRFDKIGFATPEEAWMRQQQPEMFLKKVRDAVDLSNGILTNSAVHRSKDIIEGRESFKQIPWRCISFGAWLEKFDVDISKGPE